MSQPVTLFYSYAHQDEQLRDQFGIHLSGLRRQGLIDDWHDRKIGAGTAWEKQILAQLESAQIIVLLISSDFIASDYCYKIEMTRALERHRAGEARVVPVVLRPCMYGTRICSARQPAGLPQFIAKFGVTNPNHPIHALAQGFASQLGHPVLGHHIVRIRAQARHHPVAEPRHNA